ncbi:MAG: polysaccharide biosynthesis tyrosine autokinase [Kiritimatiellae bacterium]|nr:polysaccharide biosynthesis tyrosine autokinase [Kiritimatiellia bacterium]
MNEQQEPLHFLDYWRVIQSRKEVVIAVFLLIVVTGVLVTFGMSKYYRSSCLVSVQQRETGDYEVFNRGMSRYDPLFLRTQFQIIQSPPVIEETVRRLSLTERWSKAYGYDSMSATKAFDRTCLIFANRMRVQQYRDTKLIEIQVDVAEPKKSAPQEAANAANMLAEVYRSQNVARFKKEKERALAALYSSLQEQVKKVNILESEVEDVRQKYKIDNLNSYAGSGGSLHKLSLTRMEELRIRTVLEIEDKKSRWLKIKSMKKDDLLAVAPLLVGDEALRLLVANKRAAEVELSTMKQKMLGPRHPDVQKVQAVINELDVKIDDALKAMKIGMMANYEAANSKLTALNDMMDVSRAKERSAESGGYRIFQKAQETLSHAKRIRDALEARYIQEKIELRIPRTTVEIMSRAKVPEKEDYVSPNILMNILLSILLGLSAGVGLAYFVEYLDTSLKTVEDVERFMGTPVIGVIPQKVKPFNDPASEVAHAEPYRVLRANIQFSTKFQDCKTLCVTSGSVGEGKSLTIFNLAYINAELGTRTLIVDADLHRPRQHKMMGVSNKCGLANILLGEVGIDDAIVKTELDKLDFMPSGKAASGGSIHGLLDTQKMKEVIAELRGRYDVVLFDAPPMMGVSDASVIVRDVEGVIMVIQHRKYPRTVSKRARDMVESVGANMVGIVLNNINISKDYSYYYHQYSYSYSQTPTTETKS